MEPHVHNEKCREVFALLSEYLDLELPPAACQEIEAHIAGCAPCIEFADSLRKTVALCKRYKPGEPPSPLREEARVQLKEAYDRMLTERKQRS
jgi:RNA polymerase sigma-70 factor (ECF subfamily)